MEWQIIVTLIIAIITAYVAYLNYRTRPLWIRTRERHSEDLKRILERWLSQLGTEDFVPPLHRPGSQTSIPLPVEDELLFSDLKGHIPKDFPLLNEWEDFKKNCHTYDADRSELHQQILRETKESIRTLAISKSVLTSSCALAIYEDAILLAQGKKQKWLNFNLELKSHQEASQNSFSAYLGDTRVAYAEGSKEQRQQVALAGQHLKVVLENLSKDGDKESTYVEKAKGLCQAKKKLEKQHSKLLQHINELLVIPTLPGVCRHMRGADESLFPAPAWFKYQAKWLWFMGSPIISRVWLRVARTLKSTPALFKHWVERLVIASRPFISRAWLRVAKTVKSAPAWFKHWVERLVIATRLFTSRVRLRVAKILKRVPSWFKHQRKWLVAITRPFTSSFWSWLQRLKRANAER